MCTVGIWVSKEVGKGDLREGVVVRIGRLVEFDHYNRGICICVCVVVQGEGCG